jgi:hypothetical protein
MKTVDKFHSFGESHSHTENTLEEILLDLGRAFYKLHFQLLLLIEASNKMLCALTNAARNSHASLQDMSAEIASMRQSLTRSLEIDNTESGRATPTPSPIPLLEVTNYMCFD